MDYIYLREFLENYSLPTLIIAGIVALLTLIYDRFLSEKLPNVIRNFIPFTLAVVFYFAYDMVFIVKGFSFSRGTFSAGMLSGSLSVIITSAVYKLKNGKTFNLNCDKANTIIESLISDYVIAENITNVASALKEIVAINDNNAHQDVYNTLVENALNEFNEYELKALSLLIIKAVQAIR